MEAFLGDTIRSFCFLIQGKKYLTILYCIAVYLFKTMLIIFGKYNWITHFSFVSILLKYVCVDINLCADIAKVITPQLLWINVNSPFHSILVACSWIHATPKIIRQLWKRTWVLCYWLLIKRLHALEAVSSVAGASFIWVTARNTWTKQFTTQNSAPYLCKELRQLKRGNYFSSL